MASKNTPLSKFDRAFAAHELAPYYRTQLGRAYLGDAHDLLGVLPERSISLVITSPPFALRKKKNYGNVSAEDYIEWFQPFAREVMRVLKDDGSFVIEIGGTWMPKSPTRSLYHYELLLDLTKSVGFNLAQEFYWFNPAKMPGPAQWVTVERVRCTDAVNTIWWLSKTKRPKADNRRVLAPYSDSMKRLLKHGYNSGVRPSGYIVSEKWMKDQGGAIPKNLLSFSNTASNDVYQRMCRQNDIPLHPARFPSGIPRFFIDFLTDNPSDTVVDIFAGSNVTGQVAEALERAWLAFELREAFLEASKYRFGLSVDPKIARKPARSRIT